MSSESSIKGIAGRPFRYWVLFADYAVGDGRVLGTLEEMASLLPHITFPHLLAKDVARALPVVWYAMHLPRTTLDMEQLPAAALVEATKQNTPSRIVIAPIRLAVSREWEAKRIRDPADIVFCPSEALALTTSTFSGALREPYENAREDHLASHWEYLARRTSKFPDPNGAPVEFCETSANGVFALPIHAYARQLGRPDWTPAESMLRMRTLGAYLQHNNVALVHAMTKDNVPVEDMGVRVNEYRERIPETPLHIVISAPGIARTAQEQLAPAVEFEWEQPEHNPTAQGSSDRALESLAFDVLVTHRALSTHGVGHRAMPIALDCFAQLATIERYCRAPRRRATKLRRMLREFGTRLTSLYRSTLNDPDLELSLLRRARALTVFSNFPVGLMTFPGSETPLAAAIPICYRPVQPLTHTILDELDPPPRMHVRLPLRVLVLQFISRQDEDILRIEGESWRRISSTLTREVAGAVVVVEVTDETMIAGEIAAHAPNILVISGHGYLGGTRSAEVIVGSSAIIGTELGIVPPLVVLSACHTSPRGTGSLNIADVLLRQGAVSVIGSQVPISAVRNARLLEKFFATLVVATRSHHYDITLLDVWHAALLSNVVTDIVSSSDKLLAWADSVRFETRTLLDEVEARGEQIGTATVYEDALCVLSELANKSGFGSIFRGTISSQWFIPESMFYQLLGRPELLRIGAGVNKWQSA